MPSWKIISGCILQTLRWNVNHKIAITFCKIDKGFYGTSDFFASVSLSIGHQDKQARKGKPHPSERKVELPAKIQCETCPCLTVKHPHVSQWDMYMFDSETWACLTSYVPDKLKLPHRERITCFTGDCLLMQYLLMFHHGSIIISVRRSCNFVLFKFPRYPFQNSMYPTKMKGYGMCLFSLPSF